MRKTNKKSPKPLLFGLLAVAMVLITDSSAFSANRFPILTFGDQSNIRNRQQFYEWLDDWGAMYFYAGTDTAAKYVVLNSLDIQLVAGHYLRGQELFLSNDTSIQLSQGDPGRLATSYGFLSSGNDLAHGYARSTEPADSITGALVTEGLLLNRTVVEADARHHHPGYLFNRFATGSCFRRFPQGTTAGKTDTFQAAMRLLDVSGNPSEVVARLVVTNLNYMPKCQGNADDKYAAERINDTLLRVGTKRGWKIVRAVPQRTDKLYYGPCDNPSKNKGSEEVLRYTCYANPDNPAETLCVQPFRFTKDIHVSDFPTTSSYYKFRMPFQAMGGFVPHSFAVYWTGAKTVRLDSLRIYDNKGDHFDALVKDSLPAVQRRVREYYDAHPNERKTVTAIYQIDEPAGPEFQRYQKVNTVLHGLGGSYPNHQFTVLGAYVPRDTMDQTDVSYIDTYYHYGQEAFVNYDLYFNACNLKVSSDSSKDATWQQWQVDKNLIPTLNLFRKHSQSQQSPADFWVTLPTYAAYECVGCNPHTGKCSECRMYARMPTPNEIRMWANMAVLYGARGLCYWEYMGRGGTLHAVTGQPHAESHGVEPELPYFEWAEEVSEIVPREPFKSYGEPACTTLTDAPQPYAFRGMFHVTDGDAVRDTIWYATREINHYLDSMAYFFLNASWLSAGRWTAPLYKLPGSIIDSVRTRASYDSAFIQVGFFRKDASDYAFVLNRRVDDGSAGRLDTQTVSLYLKGQPGQYAVWDVYKNSYERIQDRDGVIRYDMFLNPGEAKLIKRELLTK